MADLTRKRIADLIGTRRVDEPAEQSQWNEAQRLNDAWDELQARQRRGELTPAVFNRCWQTLLLTTDPKILGLAARLNQALRDALRQEPSA